MGAGLNGGMSRCITCDRERGFDCQCAFASEVRESPQETKKAIKTRMRLLT